MAQAVSRRVTGRFAPSPTGVLHLGNLRTALLSWCAAATSGGRWLVRMEDLDPVTASLEHERLQLEHLARIGLRPDGEVVRQSERFQLHREAIERLRADDLVYPCYCTRREVREAVVAPHGDGLPDGAYPGTCRELSDGQRRTHERAGRRAALRLRTDGERYSFADLVLGDVTGSVDDVVLQRNDGVPSYNLAVVVDDHLQGVNQVVRGDDLASSTPRQLHLQRLLGFPAPAYAHVPLVVGRDGQRLAKRHGAVTLDELVEHGATDAEVLRMLVHSIGVELPVGAGIDRVAAGFAFSSLPRQPWCFDPPTATEEPIRGDLPR
jgi:glutamyl-tRNA synthetase